jgi:hypothetical protein
MNDIEAISRAIDPGAWEDELPGMTRAAVEGFHLRRRKANAAAERVLALRAHELPAQGGAISRSAMIEVVRGYRDNAGGSASYRQACNHIIESLGVQPALQPVAERRSEPNIVLVSQDRRKPDGYELHGIFQTFLDAARHVAKDQGHTADQQAKLIEGWSEAAERHESSEGGTWWVAARQPIRPSENASHCSEPQGEVVPASFNVNDYVWVRLTEDGRQAHREYHQARYPMLEYRAPDESCGGWGKWQLWALMQEFGPMIHLGCKAPFETTIRLSEPIDQPDQISGAFVPAPGDAEPCAEEGGEEERVAASLDALAERCAQPEWRDTLRSVANAIRTAAPITPTTGEDERLWSEAVAPT